MTFDFDLDTNCLFYGDFETSQILRHCLNKTEPEVLVENNLQSVEGMSYDWISKTLYFVDGVRKTIELVRVDLNNRGRMRKTLMFGKHLGKINLFLV